MTQIIDYQSTEVWGISGTCPFCNYKFLRITETRRPGPISINEDGFGQFTFVLTYQWTCAGCNSTGPARNIDTD